MAFIGVIGEKQEFELIKNNLIKDMNKNELTLININKKSIENLQRVKFATIVVLNSLEKLLDENISLNNICRNIKYFIINSDLDIKQNPFWNISCNVITFGLNQKSTVPYSSITDETMLISVQRDFETEKKEHVEVGDYSIKIDKNDRTNLHEILVKFILEKLYY